MELFEPVGLLADRSSDVVDAVPKAVSEVKEVDVFLDIPASEYHADKEIVGHSALVQILRSPEHFKNYITPGGFKETPTLRFGTALHCAVLEPERFSQEYIESQKFDRRTKEGKAQAEAFESSCAGKLPIEVDDMQTIKAIIKKIEAHTQANGLRLRSVTEKSYFWVDEDTGIMCRIRCDMVAVDEDGRLIAIIDLKTTADASQEAFRRSMDDYGYDLQAAFYVDAVKVAVGREIPFYLLAVESGAPHGVALYRVGPKTIEVGRVKYRMGLQLLEWCRKNDSYPSYQPFCEEELIELPEWSLKRAQALYG